MYCSLKTGPEFLKVAHVEKCRVGFIILRVLTLYITLLVSFKARNMPNFCAGCNDKLHTTMQQERWVIYKPTHAGEGFKVVHEKVTADTSRPHHDEIIDGHKGLPITRELFELENEYQKFVTKSEKKQHLKEYFKTEREKAEMALENPTPQLKISNPIDVWPPMSKIEKKIKLLRKSKGVVDPTKMAFDPATTQIKIRQSFYSLLRSDRQKTIERILEQKRDDDAKLTSCIVSTDDILAKSTIKRKRVKF